MTRNQKIKYASTALALAIAGTAQAAVPAGVEAAVTGGAADIVTVIGYMIAGALTVWAGKKMLRLFGW